MKKYLKLALKMCLKHEYDPRLGYNLCCVLVRGGTIISVGYNDINKNSYVDYLSMSDPDGYRRKGFINQHSEVSAILKARKKIDLTGCDAYVVRSKPSGGVGMARPCNLCQIALGSYGIKRAIYTITDNEFGVLNLKSKSDAFYDACGNMKELLDGV